MGPKTQLVAALTLAAALGAACTNGDATRGEVVDTLTNAGLNESDAECVGNRLDQGLNQDELNEVAKAAELDDLRGVDVTSSDDDLEAFVDNALAECNIGSAGSNQGSTDEGDSSRDESSSEGNEGSDGSSDGSE